MFDDDKWLVPWPEEGTGTGTGAATPVEEVGKWCAGVERIEVALARVNDELVAEHRSTGLLLDPAFMAPVAALSNTLMANAFERTFRAAATSDWLAMLDKVLASKSRLVHSAAMAGVAALYPQVFDRSVQCEAIGGRLVQLGFHSSNKAGCLAKAVARGMLWFVREYCRRRWVSGGDVLHAAATHGHAKIVAWILAAERRLGPKSRAKAMRLAASNGHIVVVELLCRMDTPITHDVMGMAMPNVLEWMADRKRREATPRLEAAVRDHDCAGVVAALADGAMLSAGCGAAGLRWAAHYGHTEAVRALLRAGADAAAERSLALRWAITATHDEIAQVLLGAGARIADVDRSAIGAARYAILAAAAVPVPPKRSNRATTWRAPMFTFTSAECSAIDHVLAVAEQRISSDMQDILRHPDVEKRDTMQTLYRGALVMMIQAVRPLFQRARKGPRCGLQSINTGEGLAINALDEDDHEAFAIVPHAITGAFSLICDQPERDEHLERSRQVVRGLVPRIQSEGYANYVAGAPLRQDPQVVKAVSDVLPGMADTSDAGPAPGM